MEIFQAPLIENVLSSPKRSVQILYLTNMKISFLFVLFKKFEFFSFLNFFSRLVTLMLKWKDFSE